ncbi:hypothetical protein QT397_03310 [Microbulbifer sp. MKSA007]|nr:hypothetical protein QT397_03310 [Microbulbifer sp. MKSA007]
MKVFIKTIVLIQLLTLVACGGSGSGSGSGSDSSGVSPTPTTLTVTGKVISGVDGASDIELLVGDESFSTESESDGTYTLKIELDNVVEDDVAYIIAKHSSEEKIKFVSILGSIEELKLAAGEDELLEAFELPEVNLSSLSTAISAQITGGSNNGIENRESLYTYSKNIDTPYAITVASIINLLISNPWELESKNIKFPSEIEDTYLLASNESVISNYHSLINSDLIESTTEDIVNNEDLVFSSPGKGELIEDIYYLSSSDFHGVKLLIGSSNEGSLSHITGVKNFTWRETSNGIELEGAELIDSKNDEYEIKLVLNKLKWISSRKSIDSILVEYTKYKTNFEYNTITKDESSVPLNAIRNFGLLSVSNALEIGKNYIFPSPSIENTTNSPYTTNTESLEINFSGDFENGGVVNVGYPLLYLSGETSTLSIAANWYVNDRELTIEMPGAEKLTYVFYEKPSKNQIDTFFYTSKFQHEISSYYPPLISGGDYMWEEETTPAIYQRDNSIYTLNSDGTGELDLDGFNSPLVWKITTNGDLVIGFYYLPYEMSDYNKCIPDSWDIGPYDKYASCQPWFWEEWDLKEMQEQGKFWAQRIVYSPNNGEVTRLNINTYNFTKKEETAL